MRCLKFWFLLVLAGSMVACGTEGEVPGGGGPGDGDDSGATSISLSATDLQLRSDGSDTAEITVLVKNDSNQVVEGALVQFTATSGNLIQNGSVTDALGVLTATLDIGDDPTNREITVTATTGDIAADLIFTVAGTQLTVSGPSNLTSGDTGVYIFSLTDANNDGISGRTMLITSANGNDLSSPTFTTDNQGQVRVTLEATMTGEDTLEAMVLGLTASTTLDVSNDTFAFTTPDPDNPNDDEVDIGASQTLTLLWLADNVAQSGEIINVNATRGTVTPSSAVTNSDGIATFSISSTSAGFSTITALADSDGTSTSTEIEFVAITPFSLIAQSDQTAVAENEEATITATVFDVSGNRVKNTLINFNLLADNTGGSLSSGSGITDSNGQVSTVYTAGSVTSGTDGISVRAEVADNTTINSVVSLTVAQRELFVTLGLDNLISSSIGEYSKDFSVRVLDATGAALPDAEVELSVLSVDYIKGAYEEGANDEWVPVAQVVCPDEDLNRNGSIDPGEDINSNGTIEAGGRANIFPGSLLTDSEGRGLFELSYGKQFANWLIVRVEARVSVQGTEGSDTITFTLPVVATDVDDTGIAPPVASVNVGGLRVFSSPFGYGADCTVWELD